MWSTNFSWTNQILTLGMLDSFSCSFATFFKINFFKKSFQEMPSVSNSPGLDQAQCFVRPYLGPNCLQKLSADNTSRQLNYGPM